MGSQRVGYDWATSLSFFLYNWGSWRLLARGIQPVGSNHHGSLPSLAIISHYSRTSFFYYYFFIFYSCTSVIASKTKREWYYSPGGRERNDSCLDHCFVLCLVAQSYLTLCNPMGCSLPGSSVGFFRHKHWSGLPFPFLGIFPTQGSNPGFPQCRRILYCLSHQGSLEHWFTEL